MKTLKQRNGWHGTHITPSFSFLCILSPSTLLLLVSAKCHHSCDLLLWHVSKPVCRMWCHSLLLTSLSTTGSCRFPPRSLAPHDFRAHLPDLLVCSTHHLLLGCLLFCKIYPPSEWSHPIWGLEGPSQADDSQIDGSSPDFSSELQWTYVCMFFSWLDISAALSPVKVVLCAVCYLHGPDGHLHHLLSSLLDCLFPLRI